MHVGPSATHLPASKTNWPQGLFTLPNCRIVAQLRPSWDARPDLPDGLGAVKRTRQEAAPFAFHKSPVTRHTLALCERVPWTATAWQSAAGEHSDVAVDCGHKHK